MNRQIIQNLARAYRRRISEKLTEYENLRVKPKMGPAQYAGTEAQKAWAAKDLPKNTAIQMNVMGAVSTKGNPRETDVLLAGRRAQFELKKSDKPNRRTEQQLAAQVFCLGLGTFGADALYRIYADDGRVDVFTREDAAKAVAVALKEGGEFTTPAPSYVIPMDGPSSEGMKTSESASEG
jgi:hypothetical protein